MRHAIAVLLMLGGPAAGGATALWHLPIWGYLVAAVLFALGLAEWPWRAGRR